MKYPNPESYNKHIVTSVDKTLGYVYFLDKEHPLASKGGKIYYHRHVCSVKIGKWIDSSYHVHHKDGNKINNDPSNLEIISQRYHAFKHSKERGFKLRKKLICTCCKKKFISIEGRKFCSVSCSSSYNQKNLKHRITKVELEKLVWSMPTITIAKKLKCSDVAIGKLCKKWNINKPPRGYWTKVNAQQEI